MKFSSVNNFDLLRLLAAIQVVVAHSSTFFVLDESVRSVLKFVIAPFPGVPIFFVISGFLITASWLRPNQNIRVYVWSRFLRIYPALWLAVIASVFIVVFSSNYPSTSEFVAWLLAQSTLLQIYNPDFLRSFGVGVINGSLWTIPVEICFYIFVPMFFLLFKTNTLQRNAVLVFLFLSSFVVYVISYSLKDEGVFLGKLVSLTILSHLWQFLMGVFMYLYFEKIKHLVVGRVFVWFLLYLISFMLYKNSPVEMEVFLLLICRVLMAFFSISFAFSYVEILAPKTKKLGGDYSYGTYLFHALFINIFVEYNFNIGLSAIGVLLLCTFIMAYLSWKLVEYPSLKLKRVMLGRK